MRFSKKMWMSAMAAAMILAAGARAEFIGVEPTMVPVDVLTARLEKFLKDHPDDATSLYRLGRAHYLAFALKLEKIGVERQPERDGSGRLIKNAGDPNAEMDILLNRFEPGRPIKARWGVVGLATRAGDPPLEKDRDGNPWRGGITAKEMTAEAADAHLRAAVTYLRQAVAMVPPVMAGNRHDLPGALAQLDPAVAKDQAAARYHLGLACAYEDAAGRALGGVPEFAGQKKGVDATPEFFRSAAKDEYLKAYKLAIKTEREAADLPFEGLHSLVSYEAGRAYLRLADLAPVIVAHAGSQKEPDALAMRADLDLNKEISGNVERFEHLHLPPVD